MSSLLGYKRHAVLCNMGEGLLTGYLIVLTFLLFVLDSQIVYFTQKNIKFLIDINYIKLNIIYFNFYTYCFRSHAKCLTASLLWSFSRIV